MCDCNRPKWVQIDPEHFRQLMEDHTKMQRLIVALLKALDIEKSKRPGSKPRRKKGSPND